MRSDNNLSNYFDNYKNKSTVITFIHYFHSLKVYNHSTIQPPVPKVNGSVDDDLPIFVYNMRPTLQVATNNTPLTNFTE